VINDTPSGTSYTPASGVLSAGTIYYWQVKGRGTDVGYWSATWSFTTQSQTLAAPTLNSPVNGATEIPITGQTFSWNSVAGATVYRIVVDTSPTLSNYDKTNRVCLNSNCQTAVTVGNTATSYSGFTFNYNTTYYWGVVAGNPLAGPNWSATWSFTTQSQTLAAPTLNSPVNGATEIPITGQTFSWNSVAGATVYRIVVDTSPTLSNYDKTNRVCLNSNCQTAVTVGNTATSYSGFTFNYNTTYYWGVVAGNPLAGPNWSATWSFTTQGTVTVSWTTPPPSTVTSGQTFTVAWTTTGSPDHANIHWDPTDPGTPSNPQGNIDPNTCVQNSTSCSTLSPTPSPWTLTAPVVSNPTVVKYAVHVSKGGSNHAFTSIASVTVNPACGPPTPTPINLVVGNSATSGCIGKGKVQVYSFSAQLGQNYYVALIPQRGDPDLYLSSVQSCINQVPNPSGCPFRSSKNMASVPDSIAETATLTGTYYVAVYGVDDSAYTLKVVASPLARPDASNLAPVSGEPVNLTGKNSIKSSTSCDIVSYAWDFGNGVTMNGRDITYTFISSSGTTSYTVRLTVTDCNGQTDTKTITITVTGKAMGINQEQSFSTDPVNLATGNYTYEHIDLKIPGKGLPFEFKRFYNSKDSQFQGAPLGYGWSHSYNIKLSGDPMNSLVVLFGDGHSETYISNGDGTYQGEPGVYSTLVDNGNGTFTLTTKEQIKYNFDDQWRLANIADKNDNVITLSYDAFGNLDFITDTVGRTIDFVSDVSNRLIQIIDPMGRTIQFTYDDKGDLIGVTDLNGGLTQFTYDSLHQMTEATDPEGNKFVSLVYDDQRRVVQSQKDALGNVTSFEYDFQSRVTTVTDPLANKTYYFHDEQLRIISIKDSQGNTQNFEYDSNGNRTKIIDKRGYATTYSYDARGNVTTKMDPILNQTTIEYDNLNNPTKRIDAAGYTTTFEYDARGNLTKTTDPLGNYTTITYDAYGQPLTITDPNGNMTTNAYDAEGNLTEVTDPLGNKTTYTYDGVGRRLTATDPLGRTTAYTYDNNDNLLTVTDALGNVSSYTYDANNNRLTSTDPMGNRTTYTYDVKDLLTTITDPLDNTLSYAYDALDRKTSVQDKNGNITLFSYDAVGNLIEVTDPLGNKTTYTYDANGNKLTETDPLGNTISYTYDALNRVVTVTDPLGNSTTNTYDKLGRVVTTANSKGQITSFEYDALGRVTKVIDANGGTVTYTYDANGNRLTMTDPNGNTTTYEYDALNRLKTKTEPLGGQYRYSYDAAGNRVSQTDPNGNTIEYAYDELNRLVSITYPDTSVVSFEYDANGNRTRMVDGLGTSVYQYDVLNRLTHYTDPFGKTVGYGYDANGNRTSITYPDGKVVQYGYDSLNRLISVEDWGGRITRYTYDAAGRLTGVVNANGTTVAYSYDAGGRLIGLTNAKGDGTIISSYTYTLDPLGNHVSVVQDEPLEPIITGQEITYSYDAENRMTGAGGVINTFDSNGNMTAKGGDTFTYDYNDRLIQSNVGGMVTQYNYDGLGNRMRKIEGGVEKRYVLDVNKNLPNVIAETDGSGNITAYYVHGLGLISKILPDGTAAYYHYDSRGSTIALSDGSGALTDKYAYDPFGKVANIEGSTSNPFKYMGRYGLMDEGNGLTYIRARYYAPELGRFITKDPLTGKDRDSQSLNRYVYAVNNPVRLVDVSGFSALESNQQLSKYGSSDRINDLLVDEENYAGFDKFRDVSELALKFSMISAEESFKFAVKSSMHSLQSIRPYVENSPLKILRISGSILTLKTLFSNITSELESSGVLTNKDIKYIRENPGKALKALQYISVPNTDDWLRASTSIFAITANTIFSPLNAGLRLITGGKDLTITGKQVVETLYDTFKYGLW